MTRRLAIISIFLLAACSGQPDNETLAKAEAEQGAMQADNGRIDCALDGAETFSRECTTDRISGPDRELLIIQHPDGGFQRFEIVTDGRGLIAADGFDDTEIRLLDNDEIEVTAGEDRYKLPARIQSGAAASDAQ
ncbi:hypothetical protein [Novosphingopyxis sp. YJ-S2-01]|uniref:hypothetical protein n=1 Tax=Novosphingopyxis sp. YJ-S2-01 TaxID=2794021 RepID=UPI0018DE6081|nr:hypothetical protein [Novosphingopyxis sp. YJ-S2-01]MBH9538073.1 hypothetical protein [Novosphingopyxis sp. YJ-S2-01]